MALAVDPDEVARLRADMLDRYADRLTDEVPAGGNDVPPVASATPERRWRTPDLDTFDRPEDDEPAGVNWTALVDLIERHRPAWQADAACLEHPDVSFFPERGESLEPARGVCAGCLCAEECKRYAESTGVSSGVWAGVAMSRRRKAA